MPDYLKELRTAVVDGVQNVIAKEARLRAIPAGDAGRLFGSNIGYGGGNSTGETVQNFFTTGYNSGTGVTTVAFVVGFSDVGGEDIVTA